MEEKKGKHWIFIVLIILLGVIGFAAYLKLSAVRNIELEIAKVEVDQFTFTNFRLTLTVNIFNPNERPVTIDRFNARVYANNVFITSIVLAEPITIGAMDGVTQQFSATINYLDLGAAMLQAVKAKGVHWRVKGEYLLKLPFWITFPYQFDTAGSI